MAGLTIYRRDAEQDVVEATEKLWLNADRTLLVPDGDPDAAYLFCVPGKKMPAREFAKYELKGAPKKKESKPEETKEAKPKSK